MSIKRTDAQREAIAEQCRKIEKDGGDVIAYLKGLGYISARATWYNLQQEFLGRDKSHLTEGKPTNKRRKKSMEEMLAAVFAILEKGEDPLAYLADIGYVNPGSAWSNLKAWAKKNGLDEGRLPENLLHYYKEQREKKKQQGKSQEQKKDERSENEEPADEETEDGYPEGPEETEETEDEMADFADSETDPEKLDLAERETVETDPAEDDQLTIEESKIEEAMERGHENIEMKLKPGANYRIGFAGRPGRMATDDIGRDERKYQILIDYHKVAEGVPLKMVGVFVRAIFEEWKEDSEMEICVRRDLKEVEDD